jgi:hypothetical protein
MYGKAEVSRNPGNDRFWPKAASLIQKYTEIQNVCFAARTSAYRVIAL